MGGAEKKRIVCLGGGHGLSRLLRGLKGLAAGGAGWEIAAVVTVADDGGSSGRLREEFGATPPGDIRRCLAALAEDESLARLLFDYRFGGGGALGGHSLGNLILVAFEGMSPDSVGAIDLAARLLNCRGRVLPAALEPFTLAARLENGASAVGESSLDAGGGRIVWLESVERRRAPEETLEAVRGADALVFGPGSLYTSILPNLLAEGLPEAVRASRAPKILVANLCNDPRETPGYRLSDYVREVNRYCRGGALDAVLIDSRAMSRQVEELRIEIDEAETNRLGAAVWDASLASDSAPRLHDPARLARRVAEVVEIVSAAKAGAEKDGADRSAGTSPVDLSRLDPRLPRKTFTC